MIRFSEQFRSRITSQYINSISRVVQKLTKYFHAKTIFTFSIPELLLFYVILDLNLNDLESVMVSSDIN